jgi:hypothetical protein
MARRREPQLMEQARRLLAVAIKRLNEAYRALPEPRPAVDDSDWRQLEAAIDAAFAAGDCERALRAIADWEQHGADVLGRAEREAA